MHKDKLLNTEEILFYPALSHCCLLDIYHHKENEITDHQIQHTNTALRKSIYYHNAAPDVV